MVGVNSKFYNTGMKNCIETVFKSQDKYHMDLRLTKSMSNDTEC